MRPPASTRAEWFRDGIVAGLLGFMASAGVYALIDLALGHSLFFASRTLSSDLFGGRLASAHPLAGPLAYDGLRLLLTLSVGLGMAYAIRQTERRPPLPMLALVGGISALAVTEGGLALFARPLSAAHWAWVVVVANLVAGLTMGVFVLYRLLLRELHAMARHLS